ncbi:sarcosine oxidase subunit delta [Mesorhizobium sp.]|uniref:sarcosine oxidase subunit delta n=1 Tax=Mesorhizobium sp. TaxID=1871066 RepID=UPI0025D255A1|nr:sarcosine oxidase subunit delta [Mesorhizobium sp.]
MHIFSCPYCGPRDETEFHFALESGKHRPEPAAAVSNVDWAHYLHFKRNPKGETSEVWLHLTCGEYFVMRRDTLSHDVHETRCLHGGRP